MKRATLILCIVAAAGLLAGHAASADNWPAWRGDGSGVSSETALPERWSRDANVAWKTRIPGEGISSPVVWGDHVFVTTANQGRSATVSHGLIFAIGGGLLLVALAGLVSLGRSGKRAADSSTRPTGMLRTLSFLDRGATAVALALFLVGLALILGDSDLADEGSVNRTWLMSGVIGMVGLIGAVGILRPGSTWHFLGSVSLAAAGLFYLLAVPDTRGNNPIELPEVLVTSGPLFVAAAWGLLLVFLFRRGGAPPRAAAGAVVAALAILLLVALEFAFLNHLRSRIEFQRSVVAIDRNDGTILWQTPVFVALRGPKYVTNSYATPTPVTDGERVVVDFGLGLASLDFDGNIEWKIEEPEYFTFVRYGSGDSPVMWRDLLIYSFVPEFQGEELGFGYSANGHLTALDKTTGETRWSIVPPGARDAYNTPLLVPINGRAAVVLLLNRIVVAYDARTGEEIWRCEVPITQGVPSMVSDARHVYAIGGTHGPKGAVAIRSRGTGNITKKNIAWTVNQGVPEVPSPVLYDGLLYMVTDSGVATCLDPRDGSRVWRKRLSGKYNASLLAGDGKVYFFATDGTTTVVRAGREFEEIAENELDEEIMASPAVSGGQILLRTREHLYSLGGR